MSFRKARVYSTISYLGFAGLVIAAFAVIIIVIAVIPSLTHENYLKDSFERYPALIAVPILGGIVAFALLVLFIGFAFAAKAIRSGEQIRRMRQFAQEVEGTFYRDYDLPLLRSFAPTFGIAKSTDALGMRAKHPLVGITNNFVSFQTGGMNAAVFDQSQFRRSLGGSSVVPIPIPQTFFLIEKPNSAYPFLCIRPAGWPEWNYRIPPELGGSIEFWTKFAVYCRDQQAAYRILTPAAQKMFNEKLGNRTTLLGGKHVLFYFDGIVVAGEMLPIFVQELEELSKILP